jgi:hypothetical protein
MLAYAPWALPVVLLGHVAWSSTTYLFEPFYVLTATGMYCVAMLISLVVAFNCSPVPSAGFIGSILRTLHHVCITALSYSHAHATFIENTASHTQPGVALAMAYAFWSYVCMCAWDVYQSTLEKKVVLTGNTGSVVQSLHHCLTLALISGAAEARMESTALAIAALYSATSIPLNLRRVLIAPAFVTCNRVRVACDAALLIGWFGMRMPTTVKWSLEVYNSSNIELWKCCALAMLNGLNVMWSGIIIRTFAQATCAERQKRLANKHADHAKPM